MNTMTRAEQSLRISNVIINEMLQRVLAQLERKTAWNTHSESFT